MRGVSDGLPKTYRQPIGPATSRGMGCRIIGSRVARKRKRPSNQLPTANSQRFMAGSLVGQAFEPDHEVGQAGKPTYLLLPLPPPFATRPPQSADAPPLSPLTL